MTTLPSGSGESRPSSMRDVASAAGVSYQTVSRVLNDHPSIRDETRSRVLDAMARLQYRPNAAARALRGRRSRTIGILVTMRSQWGPSQSVEAIERAARARGLFVTSASASSADPDEIAGALDNLIAQDIEGLVVIAPQQRVFETIRMLAPQIPYVGLRSERAGESNAIRVNENRGARIATRHLIELGHTSIRHLAGPRDWIEADARMQGYLDEMSAHDLPIVAPVLGDWSSAFGYRAGLRLLPAGDVSAYFCGNDHMALGLMHAARELGIDIPGDLSLIGYDDVPEAEHLAPPLTTMHQRFADMGRRCVTMLLEDQDGRFADDDLAPELVVRESTRRLG